MAKATLQVVKTIKLELSVREATFLMHLVEVSMLSPGKQEPQEEVQMRKDIADALRDPSQTDSGDITGWRPADS